MLLLVVDPGPSVRGASALNHGAIIPYRIVMNIPPKTFRPSAHKFRPDPQVLLPSHHLTPSKHKLHPNPLSFIQISYYMPWLKSNLFHIPDIRLWLLNYLNLICWKVTVRNTGTTIFLKFLYDIHFFKTSILCCRLKAHLPFQSLQNFFFQTMLF